MICGMFRLIHMMMLVALIIFPSPLACLQHHYD